MQQTAEIHFSAPGAVAQGADAVAFLLGMHTFKGDSRHTCFSVRSLQGTQRGTKHPTFFVIVWHAACRRATRRGRSAARQLGLTGATGAPRYGRALGLPARPPPRTVRSGCRQPGGALGAGGSAPLAHEAGRTLPLRSARPGAAGGGRRAVGGEVPAGCGRAAPRGKDARTSAAAGEHQAVRLRRAGAAVQVPAGSAPRTSRPVPSRRPPDGTPPRGRSPARLPRRGSRAARVRQSQPAPRTHRLPLGGVRPRGRHAHHRAAAGRRRGAGGSARLEGKLGWREG